MKIYTKTGDKGTTSLFGGKRVAKNDPVVAAVGALDELNAYLGIVCSESKNRDLIERIERIQGELFVIGSIIATPATAAAALPRLELRADAVARLEQEIDGWDEVLVPLKNFILPGGSKTGSQLHYARTVCRRAERVVVALPNITDVDEAILSYLNRLSDWLFVAARVINAEANMPETIWRGAQTSS